MFYIKICTPDGETIGAERMEVLQYVKQNTGRIRFLRCSEREAQGIISLDMSEIYYLDGKTPFVGIEAKVAKLIDGAEYREIVGPEDEPGGDPEDEIPASDEALTREELTAKVTELEATNEMLMECIMEMSEIVYA